MLKKLITIPRCNPDGPRTRDCPGSYASLNKSNANTELQCFTIKIRNIKKMLILNSYHPPKGNLDKFFEDITSSLFEIRNLNEYEIYIIGDWNIPFNVTDSVGFKKIEQFCSSFGLNQVINIPTSRLQLAGPPRDHRCGRSLGDTV